MQNIFVRCCSGQNSSSACKGTNCCTSKTQQQQQQQQPQEPILNNGQPDKRSFTKPDVLPLRSPLRSPRIRKFNRLSDIVIEEEPSEGQFKFLYSKLE